MPADRSGRLSRKEATRLVDELTKAEMYEQRLRQFIIDAMKELEAGNPSLALSIMNEALNDIDSATDVVTGNMANE